MANSLQVAVLAAALIGAAGSTGQSVSNGVAALLSPLTGSTGTETPPPEPTGPTAEQIAFQDWYNMVESLNQADCGSTIGAVWGGWPSSGGTGCDAKEYQGTPVDTLIWW